MLDQEHIGMLKSVLTADKFQELITLYITDTERLLKECRKNLNSSDAGMLRENAHSIKGSSGNMGITGMYEAAKALEDSAKSGDLSSANSDLSILQTLFPRAQDALNTL
jgi:HPt (histidine-containing phosphotransfer) domain-containing protein